MGFLSKLLTMGEGKQLKGYEEQAARINDLEPAMQALSDEELRDDYIIPEAFDPRVGPAVAKAVAEAARRSGVARI